MQSHSVTRVLFVLSLAVVFQLVTPGVARADPIQTIARILEGLNHFPSDAEKEALMEISADDASSKALHAIAMAVHNMSHRASDEDKSTLAMILEDEDTSESERVLAGIVMRIDHAASDEDKAMLASLAGAP